jgi:hypothetical protein
MWNATPVAIAALLVELVPAVAFGFRGEGVSRAISRWTLPVRLLLPAVLVAP